MHSLNAAFDALLKFFAGIAGVIFALTALSISVNVVLRNTAGTTIFGLLDAVEYGLLAATFLAAPWVLWKHAHVTVDLLTASLKPAVARPLARAVAVLGFVVSAVFLWYAVEAAMVSAARGSMIRTAFVVPEWWALSAAPLGFVLICIEFLRQAVRPQLSHDMAGL
jgi:TRAP-type C4-dicarboxylate transport system permease small subunit